MLYLSLKYAHLLSMVLLFGTGLGSAWYKWMADRSGNIIHMAATNRQVVLADWLFTTPSIVLQPLTGLYLLLLLDMSFSTFWVVASFILYVIAGLCWLPVVWLQIRMREVAEQAVSTGSDLPPCYWHYARCWFWFGVPAFSAMLLVVSLMVFKPI